MSIARRIELRGLEDALRDKIASTFRFEGDHLKNVALVAGVHLYVQEIPSAEAADQSATAKSIPFEPATDTMIGIFTAPSQGLEITTGSGSKQDWTLRFIVRINDTPARAKDLCEELMNFVLGTALKGKVGNFIAKAIFPGTRPVSFRREGDDGRLAQSIVRVLGVSLK